MVLLPWELWNKVGFFSAYSTKYYFQYIKTKENKTFFFFTFHNYFCVFFLPMLYTLHTPCIPHTNSFSPHLSMHLLLYVWPSLLQQNYKPTLLFYWLKKTMYKCNLQIWCTVFKGFKLLFWKVTFMCIWIMLFPYTTWLTIAFSPVVKHATNKF